MRSGFRTLLRLYPTRFRDRHGAEVLAAIEADRARRRVRGTLSTLRFLVEITLDLVASGVRERARQVAGMLNGFPSGGVPRLPARQERTVMDALLQDVRQAMRQFARRPGFTAIAVLSLALGIGGNTLMYSVIDGYVLHPFDYPEPARLVTVGVTFPKLSSDTRFVEVLSPAEYADIRQARSFASLGAFDLGNRNIAGGDVPERVFAALLLDDLFPVIGMKPALGRGFTREELVPGGTSVAIISHRLWQTRFGGDPGVLNRSVRIGGESASIVGVMPPGLLLIGTDLWMPWGGDPARVPRERRQFTVLGRLAPGVPLEQANAELDAIARQVEQAERTRLREYEGWRLVVTSWAEALLQDVRPAAFVLLGAVGFVLLIACANLASLFLARATARQRELAVRLALGAARWRLARQLLTETLLLSAAGASAGLLLVYAGLRGADALIPAQFRTFGLDAGFNVRVLSCTVGLAIASALLVALIPAWQATRTDPHESLKAEARIGSSPRGRVLRHLLVVGEIALSVLLLLGAGLMIRSFHKLQQVDPGVDSRGVLTMRLTLPADRYRTSETITTFFEQLLDRVHAVPGVISAGMASQFPPLGPFSSQIEVEGAPAAGSTLPTANSTIVSRGYFRTLNVPVIAGRIFDERDRRGGPRVVVVNEAFAGRYLSGRPAIGARVRLASRDGSAPWSEIIGVVRSARNQGLAEPPQPEVFVSMERGRDAWNQLFLLVRSDRELAGLLPDLRQAVRSIDSDQPVYAIQTLQQAMAGSIFQQRLAARLLAVFAAAAVVLAAIGIYGVMSFAVTTRTQEMGVRLAVGAQRRDVMWLVLSQVLWLTAAGLAIGTGLLLAVGRLLEQLLYGVEPADPATIAAVCTILGAVALAAAWVPAFRASRVDVIEALRYE